MASLETETTFNGSLESIFEGIKKYDKYPKYLPGVTRIDVLPPKEKGSVCQVRYELNIVKTFFYVLNMFEDGPKKIWWTLDDSNILKSNNGSWTFKQKGKEKTKTHAVYKLDIKFKGLIPGVITDQVAKANLPLMMTGFQKLIDDSQGA
jgi:ribosome-associated toxin RatA of RatAB toxin-antitoxin module